MNHYKKEHTREQTKKIKTAFLLNSVFILIEIGGGLLTNSMAILSDALHDLGDSLSLGLAWYFQKISYRQKDRRYSFGYKRFSLLGAVINSMVLIVGSTFILNETIPRLFNPEAANARGMLLLALLGVAVNGWAVLALKKGKSINEKVVSLHLLEDVLGWLVILVGSVVMMAVDFPMLDPLLSVFITIFILINVFKILKKIFRVFLQAVPLETNLTEIEKIILDTPGVNSIHDFHVWSLDGQYNILTLHLVVDEPGDYLSVVKIRQHIKQSLKNLKIDHITIETHQKDEECFLEKCI